jgi:putative DNA-invertase from lambdoid prophage Rac
MKTAIYARVSTTDQNCEMQLRELREYCARRGWEITAEYVDTGWSGAKASRPQLDRCMADAKAHRFESVLVWKLDRFSRSMLHLNQQLANLNSWGVRFMAITQNIDTDQTNPTSRLLLQILGAVAEFERETIRERVKAGMTTARHKGIRLGRPKRVFDRVKVEALRKRGMSVREIAAELGLGKGTVERALKASQNGVSTPAAKPLIQ